MSTITEKTTVKKKTTSKKSPKKKMTMWDYVLKFEKKPLIKVLDEDLVFGPNMWTRLMQLEEKQ